MKNKFEIYYQKLATLVLILKFEQNIKNTKENIII